MKTFFWLVRREFWANKGLFLWAPLAIGFALLFLFVSLELSYSSIFEIDKLNAIQHKVGEAGLIKFVHKEINREINFMSHFFINTLMIAGAFLSSAYLIGSLHDDRRDRSIYFWKSLPISDSLEVWAKLVFPLILAPLLNLMIAVVSFFVASLVIAIYSIFGPVNVFITIISNMELFEFALEFMLILPYYVLWSLPTVAWFLMISARTNARVAPWAIGLPLLCVALAGFFNMLLKLNWDTRWILNQVISRWIGANVPASWVDNKEAAIGLLQRVDPASGRLKLERLSNVDWGSPSLWIGVAAGLTMILISIRLRKNAEVLAY